MVGAGSAPQCPPALPELIRSSLRVSDKQNLIFRRSTRKTMTVMKKRHQAGFFPRNYYLLHCSILFKVIKGMKCCSYSLHGYSNSFSLQLQLSYSSYVNTAAGENPPQEFSRAFAIIVTDLIVFQRSKVMILKRMAGPPLLPPS